MKKSILVLGLVAAFSVIGSVKSMAYSHDDRGWYDEHHHRHGFIMYHHHRGYWDHRNGVKVFIHV